MDHRALNDALEAGCGLGVFAAIGDKVFKLGLAKSIHHARVLIRQRHIRVRKQVVNVASFVVRLDSQKHIDFATTSPFGGGRPGRVRRKKAKAAESKEAGGDEEEEEE